ELTIQGWMARVAVAATVGAAWALSRYAQPVCIAPAEQIEPLLRSLPLAALRLPDEKLLLLARLGLRRVGDVLNLPRRELGARFGALLLQRLDEALGQRPEMIVPPEAEPKLWAEEVLDYP